MPFNTPKKHGIDTLKANATSRIDLGVKSSTRGNQNSTETMFSINYFSTKVMENILSTNFVELNFSYNSWIIQVEFGFKLVDELTLDPSLY